MILLKSTWYDSWNTFWRGLLSKVVGGCFIFTLTHQAELSYLRLWNWIIRSLTSIKTSHEKYSNKLSMKALEGWKYTLVDSTSRIQIVLEWVFLQVILRNSCYSQITCKWNGTFFMYWQELAHTGMYWPVLTLLAYEWGGGGEEIWGIYYFDHFLTDITQFEFPDTFAVPWLAQFVLTFDQSQHLQKKLIGDKKLTIFL